MWEYKKVGSLDEAALNELGTAGWELVACEGHCMVFRRPKSSSGEPDKAEQMVPEKEAIEAERTVPPKKGSGKR